MFFNDPSQKRIQVSWVWSEDRQWARSAFRKNWDDSKSLSWWLEVRTEEAGSGSIRLGEMVIRGSMTGTLSMSIAENT